MKTFHSQSSLHVGNVVSSQAAVRVTGSRICSAFIVVLVLRLVSPSTAGLKVPATEVIGGQGATRTEIDSINVKASMDNMTSQLSELRSQQEQRFSRLLSVIANTTADWETKIKNLKKLVCAIGHNQGCGILVQQHFAGSGSPFYQNWNTFRDGFGSTESNYWIGNEKLHTLTMDGRCRLRIDLQAKVTGLWYFAEYSKFIVDSEETDYRLRIGGYRGNAGDSFHVPSPSGAAGDDSETLDWMCFSTYNRDEDQWEADNCASSIKCSDGGFWFNSCGRVYINGGVASRCGFTWMDLPTGPTLADKQLLVSRMTLFGC